MTALKQVLPHTEIQILMSVKWISCLWYRFMSICAVNFFCNKSFISWMKSNVTPLLNMCVTLGKILNRCESIFSSENGENNCLYFVLFSGIEIMHVIVSVLGVVNIFSKHFCLLFRYTSIKSTSHKHLNYHLIYKIKKLFWFIPW